MFSVPQSSWTSLPRSRGFAGLLSLAILAYLYLSFSYICIHLSNVYTHLIQTRLSSELLHCAMPRPQRIVVHIASMSKTRMSPSHSRHPQCYLKIHYINGTLRSRYTTLRNAQCNNSEDNLFKLGVYVAALIQFFYGGHSTHL